MAAMYSVRDIITAHMISADAQTKPTNKQTNKRMQKV